MPLERLVVFFVLYFLHFILFQLTISTVDHMKNQLVFKTNIIEIQGKVLIDFRLSKGCGIEFKKKFKKLKECLDDIVEKDE